MIKIQYITTWSLAWKKQTHLCLFYEFVKSVGVQTNQANKEREKEREKTTIRSSMLLKNSNQELKNHTNDYLSNYGISFFDAMVIASKKVHAMIPIPSTLWFIRSVCVCVCVFLISFYNNHLFSSLEMSIL